MAPSPPLDEREPPWSAFPTLQWGDIGWRMGSGEDYRYAWYAFFDALPAAERIAYLHRHPPAPRNWGSHLATCLVGRDDPSDDDVADALDRLVAAGRIRSDVAYAVFVRNEIRDGGTIDAPWAWPGRWDPAIMMRHWTRPLSFWGRWIATERAEGRLADWIAGCPPVPEPWRRIVMALTDATIASGDPATQVVCEIAATGAPQPPWRDDAIPPDRDFRFDDPALPDVWCWWVFCTFDDAESYHAHLQRHPPTDPWMRQLRAWFPDFHDSVEHDGSS